jgi:hypothetical protein
MLQFFFIKKNACVRLARNSVQLFEWLSLKLGRSSCEKKKQHVVRLTKHAVANFELKHKLKHKLKHVVAFCLN